MICAFWTVAIERAVAPAPIRYEVRVEKLVLRSTVTLEKGDGLQFLPMTSSSQYPRKCFLQY